MFSFCGFPTCIHSDRGSPFIFNELKSFKGIATSNSNPYHPISGQVGRYNGSIWGNIRLALKTHNLDVRNWELFYPIPFSRSVRYYQLQLIVHTMRDYSVFLGVHRVELRYPHG